LLLTNAAGAIHPKFKPGDFMRITDHLNFMGANPLRGAWSRRKNGFVDLSAVYDPQLGRRLTESARETGVPVRKGVYAAVSGPSYETPAEIRAFAALGADAVGMSTVPEAIVARQCELSVAGLSCITNYAAGRSRAKLCHEEVLRMGNAVGEKAAELVTRFARSFDQGSRRVEALKNLTLPEKVSGSNGFECTQPHKPT
jgi:purine-nucleoside phosphorylase